jgi:hypothetical protein
MWQPVSSAEPIPHCSFAVLGFFPVWPKINEGGLDIAPITPQKPKPNLPQPLEPLLHQRALRLRNREPKAVAQYMQTHMNLSRGR